MNSKESLLQLMRGKPVKTVKVRSVKVKPVKVQVIKPEKPPDRKKLVKELDKLWSQAVHLIYKNRCGGCSKNGNQAHHCFTKKAHPSVRWELDNGILMCFGCHILKVHRRGNYEFARDILIERIGMERFIELKEKANRYVPLKVPDLLALKESLSQNLAMVNGENQS